MGNRWFFHRVNKLSYENNTNNIEMLFRKEDLTMVSVSFSINTNNDTADIVYQEFINNVCNNIINNNSFYNAIKIYCKPNPRWISITYN